MKISILGAGNGGCAVAGDLSFKGHDVTLIKTSNSMHNNNFEFLCNNDGLITLIENGKDYSHNGFENKLYAIVPEHDGDYHMCEELAKGFMDDGRWEEVFMALYGDMPKYSYLKKEQ